MFLKNFPVIESIVYRYILIWVSNIKIYIYKKLVIRIYVQNLLGTYTHLMLQHLNYAVNCYRCIFHYITSK